MHAQTALSTSAARGEFAKAVKRVARDKERIVLRRHNKDVAALVSMEDLEVLEYLGRVIDIAEARQRDDQAEIPIAEVKSRLGLG